VVPIPGRVFFFLTSRMVLRDEENGEEARRLRRTTCESSCGEIVTFFRSSPIHCIWVRILGCWARWGRCGRVGFPSGLPAAVRGLFLLGPPSSCEWESGFRVVFCDDWVLWILVYESCIMLFTVRKTRHSSFCFFVRLF